MQIAYLIAAAVAYLVGSVPFAVIVSRAMGLADPRTYGSGNPGATNVLRTGNKLAAALTLFGDAFKGWLAVWLAARYGPVYGLGETGIAIVAVAVFIGHLYPVFLWFHGGKGIATAGGVLVAFNPWLALAAALTWLIIATISRYSSLASIAAAVCAPFYSSLLQGFDAQFAALAVIGVLAVYRHRVNIRSLRAGTERRIGQSRQKVRPG